MSNRNYLANIKGFTPAPTTLSNNRNFGAYGALVWGVIWRYTQLKNGKCFAKLETLAEEIGVSIPTFIKYRDRLIADGYFEDVTPLSKNSSHILVDTHKLFIKTETAIVEDGVKDVNSKSSAAIKDVNSTVKDVNSRYKGALHKDSIKDNNKDNNNKPQEGVVIDKPNIFTIYERDIGMIPNNVKILDELKDADAHFPEEWIDKAFTIAVEQNKRRWSYVRAILDRWQTDGIDDKVRKEKKAAKIIDANKASIEAAAEAI